MIEYIVSNVSTWLLGHAERSRRSREPKEIEHGTVLVSLMPQSENYPIRRRLLVRYVYFPISCQGRVTIDNNLLLNVAPDDWPYEPGCYRTWDNLATTASQISSEETIPYVILSSEPILIHPTQEYQEKT